MNRLNLDQELACLGPCDVNLVTKDGKHFQAHRNVLLRASPFFEKLLSSDMKESNEGVIRLPTVTDSQMPDILQFIYNGSVQFASQENAEKLIETADFLLLSNLKTIAGKFLKEHMTSETCISMNYMAEQYSCEVLVASTRKFINSNFTTVTASEEFLNLPSYEVEKWISSDDIVIDAEENVFETILRWIGHDKSERSGKFSELFTHVRLTCVSRDYLLSYVVTNDLVKKNADCLDRVTGALEWPDGLTDCDVSPRPHPPRKSLTINVIVIYECFASLQPCIYLPATDEWYLLQARPGFNETDPIFSFRGKNAGFFVTENNFGLLWHSSKYGSDSNRFCPVPELYKHSCHPLFVQNQICFFIENNFQQPGTDLWIYNCHSNSRTQLPNWVERVGFCSVAVDRYIYVLGGRSWNSDEDLTECARFNTEQNGWQKIAPLNEARRNAFGVCKNEKIFIAGGCGSTTCEVYSILTDEWQFIASLTSRILESMMVLADETLYVLTNWGKRRDGNFKVECYNHENNEWNVKATVPINKMTNQRSLFLKGCSFRVFKGVLNTLELIDESD